MAGHLDSQSVFTVRLAALGIDQAQITTLVNAGVNSMARLAYICSIQPGVADDTPFFQALSSALGLASPNDIPVGDRAAYRRAWFESSTVAIAEIRSKVESTQDDLPKRMPKEERNNRHRQQQQRLGGIKIEGAVEPSHGLLDAVWAMREDDTLRYLNLEVCTSRSQEVLGIKKETFVRAEPSTGNLKQVTKDINPTADLTTEYRVKLAFTRRALAFDSCELCTFSIMEELHDYLYGLVMKEGLESHQPISVQQIIKADRQLWIRLIELTREGIAPDSTGKKPIETYLPLARMDPLFNALLQPLPKSHTSFDKAMNMRPFHDHPYQANGKAGRGKKGGKGKGKGLKGKGRGAGSIPEELKGLRSQTGSGYPYCWGYNMAVGCPLANKGGYCHRGFHGCMKCGVPQHGAHTCDKK
jgi:hypothetical protein